MQNINFNFFILYIADELMRNSLEPGLLKRSVNLSYVYVNLYLTRHSCYSDLP